MAFHFQNLKQKNKQPIKWICLRYKNEISLENETTNKRETQKNRTTNENDIAGILLKRRRACV